MFEWILKCLTSLTLLTPVLPMTHTHTSTAHVIILLGPPGVGKGSQAAKIQAHLKLPHISTGDLFRENIKNQTPLGIKVKACIEKGDYVSDALVLDMLFERLKQADCKQGYILDGFPRTLDQAKALDQYLGQKVRLHVINLAADDQTVIDRISGRLVCQSCGKTFHIDTHPPKKPMICDHCNGSLYQRADDKREVVTQRLNTYKEQTKPLITYYENKKLLRSIDSEQSIDKVYQEICHILDSKETF